jgi:hypothetical protein
MGLHGRAYALDESDAGYQIKAAASCPIDAAGRAGLRPYLFYRPNYRFFFFFFA